MLTRYKLFFSIVFVVAGIFLAGLLSCYSTENKEKGFPSTGRSAKTDSLLAQINLLKIDSTQTADSLLQAALVLFKKEDYQFGIATVYQKLSQQAYRRQERIKAADLNALAGEAYRAADSIDYAFYRTGHAGFQYLNLGEYAKSTVLLQEALELAMLSNDSLKIGWTLNDLSLPYQYSYNDAQAEVYLLEAKEINESIKDDELGGAISLNLGNIYGDREDYEKAYSAYRRANLLGVKVGNNELGGLALINMAAIHIDKFEYSEAIDMLSGWSEGKVDSLLPHDKAYFYTTLARSFLKKGQTDQAVLHVTKACELALETGESRNKIECLELKSLLAEKRGDMVSALTNLKEFHQLEKEITGEKTDKQLRSIKESYEIKIRDQEITELKNEELLRQKREKNQRIKNIIIFTSSILAILGLLFSIRSSLNSRIAHQQKEIAEAQLHFLQARMSPHFVFNALNGIQNQVLQAAPFSAYEYISKFSSLLRVITNTTSKPEISLSDEIALLRNYLDLEQLRFRDGFSSTVDAEGELLSLNPMIPAMMIQPVIENAIIHGLSESEKKGEISVRLSLQKDTVCCVVTDNGIGREASTEISKKEKEHHLSISTENLKKRFIALERLGYPMKPFTTLDLFDGGKASGTQVTLYLPIIGPNI